jgi:hypothetical protein
MPGKTPGRRRASPPRSPTPLEGSRRRSGIWVKEKRHYRQYTDPVASRARKTIASLPDEQGTHRTLSSKGWTGRKRQVLVARGRREPLQALGHHVAADRRDAHGTEHLNDAAVWGREKHAHCGKFLEFLAATEMGLRGRRRGRRMTEGVAGRGRSRSTVMSVCLFVSRFFSLLLEDEREHSE